MSEIILPSVIHRGTEKKVKLKKFHPKFCGSSLLLSQKSVGACTPLAPLLTQALKYLNFPLEERVL